MRWKPSRCTQLPPGPLAVVHLDEPVVDGHLELTRLCQRGHRLLATLQRGTHQRCQRQLRETPYQRLSLGHTALVEGHPQGAPGQHARGVRRGPAMSKQDHGAHAATLRTR
jgi:hypothetical protein